MYIYMGKRKPKLSETGLPRVSVSQNSRFSFKRE